MPIDHYKVSMESRPLKLLYSKYAEQIPLLPGSVRPLGSVRRGMSPARDDHHNLSLFKLECEVTKAERVERYLAMSGDNLVADTYGSKRSLYSVSDNSDDRNQTSTIRSRSKSFENKYKLALSRGSHDTTVSKQYSKRVIQLPMLKINLETYVGESEDTKTLESTRKSLRNILDISSKPGHMSGLRQASITQYQFKTPGEMHREAMQQANIQTCAEHQNRHVEHPEQMSDRQTSWTEPDVTSMDSDGEFRTTSGVSQREDDYAIYEIDEAGWDDEESEGVFDVDSSSLMAQRLSSAATLGTSYKHLDFESFSSDADEPASKDIFYRTRPDMEGLDPDHFNEYPPKWPNFEDSRNLRVDNGAYGLSIKPRLSKDGRSMERGTPIFMKKDPPDSFVIRNGVVPKFKTTKLHPHIMKPRRKLDPMAPQPHSSHDCPMCNLYKVKEPTVCPPNTPRRPDEVIPDILSTINHDCLKEGVMAPVGEEEYAGGEAEEVNGSEIENVVFRRRHELINYDINATPRLGPISRKSVVRTMSDHRFGYIPVCPKTAT